MVLRTGIEPAYRFRETRVKTLRPAISHPEEISSSRGGLYEGEGNQQSPAPLRRGEAHSNSRAFAFEKGDVLVHGCIYYITPNGCQQIIERINNGCEFMKLDAIQN